MNGIRIAKLVLAAFSSFSLEVIMYWVSLLTLVLTLSSLKAYGDEITMWTRKPGDYSLGKKLDKMEVQTLNLNKIKNESRTLHDVHYQKAVTFKGVSLMDLVATYNAPPTLNLALLHFKNGMIYPVRREDRKSLQKIFVAHMVKLKKGLNIIQCKRILISLKLYDYRLLR